jgi:uncharacterized protein YkwD
MTQPIGLRPVIRFFFLMVLAAALTGCPVYTGMPPVTLMPDNQDEPEAADQEIRQLEDEAFGAVNNERAQNGLTAMTHSEELRLIARAHSQDMADRQYFAHEDPEGHGLQHRLEVNAVACSFAAENIAYATGYDNPVPVVVADWMQSEGHRNNILDWDGEVVWEYAGMGVAIGDETVYFTQVFLVPAAGKELPAAGQMIVLSSVAAR